MFEMIVGALIMLFGILFGVTLAVFAANASRGVDEE